NYESFFEIPFAWRCCRFHDVARSWPTGPEQLARQIDHPGRSSKEASRHFLMSRPPLLTRRGVRLIRGVKLQTRRNQIVQMNHPDCFAAITDDRQDRSRLV